MKTIILITLTLFAGFVAEAQNNGTYVMRYIHYDATGASNYAISHIVSDYGPRNSSGDSFWHRGIDYQPNQQRGNKILSPCNGTIRGIRKKGSMFYMIVEGATGQSHFGYAHLFRNVTITKGQFWEEGPAGREMAIYRQNEDDYIIINMDPANRYALAALTITRDTITYKGVLYNIQSGVTTDKPLAILGDSGAEGKIHLHIYAYRNIQQALTNFQSIPNCYDPMAVIQLSPRTNFKCRVQNVGVNYGSASKSHFKTRVEMPGGGNGNTYTNHMYDVNLVELFIKPAYKQSEPQVSNWGTTNSSYQYYRGEHTKSYINQGGRPQESSSSMYPISPSDHNITSSNNGNAQNTGVEPFAYRDHVGRPYDFFWFSDFYPRIRNSHAIGTALQFARHNLEARYPDGNYEALLRVATSVNNIHSSVGNTIAANDSLTSFQIDNFLPFVQKVEAYTDGSTTATYVREWKPISSGNFVFDPDPNVWLPKANSLIAIYTSEGMSKLSLRINNYYEELTLATNPEKTKWLFSVPADYLVNHEKNQLEINGEDVHGNLLQKNAQTIPIRQSATNWNPAPTYGLDVNHKIQIGTSDINFSYVQLGSGAYRFSASSPHTVYQYNWSYGTENSCYNCGSEAEYTFQNTGVYLVNLSVMSSAGFLNVTKEVVVQTLIAPVPNFYYSPRPWPPNRGKDLAVEVDFYDNTEGIVASYNWDFGNGETSNEQNPKGISFQANTNYNVNLLVTNASGSPSVSKSVYVDPSIAPWAGLIAWKQTDYLWDFDASVANLDAPFTYEIDYGDGYTQSFSGDNTSHLFNHYYNVYGRYQVSVKITGTDYYGTLQSAYQVTEISAQPDQLLISLMDVTNPGDKYPYTNVDLKPVLENSEGFTGSTMFSLIFWITKSGDPTYRYVQTETVWGTTFPTYSFQFEEAGDYQVQLTMMQNDVFWSGSVYYPIQIVNAPKYLSANICCQPYQVCLGAANTFFGQLEPIGSPGIEENKWFPTNIRWTLYDQQGVVKDTKEEEFLPEEYSFTKWFSYIFNQTGTYTLRLETWNNTHGYATSGLLDPKYVNTISYYAVTEKQITVTQNMGALNVSAGVNGYFTYNAEGTAIGSAELKISNPGTIPISWQVVIPSEFSDWIETYPVSGSNLSNGSQVNILLSVVPNQNDETRYGYFYIRGFDAQGNEVQGSPAGLQVEQYGVEGPAGEFIVGTNSSQQFGFAVSVDGKTAVIGAPGKSAGNASSVFVYQKNNIGQWTQRAQLTPPAGQQYFGRAVSINGDYIIASGLTNAAIYKKPASGWSGNVSPLKLLEGNISNADFGVSVDIWGEYAVVGAPAFNSGKGKVYIYYRHEGGYDQWGRQKMFEGQSNNDFYGTSVSMYNDLLAVGAPQENSNPGYIAVYDRNKTDIPWALEQIIIPEQSTLQNVKFGYAVSIFENKIATSFRSFEPYHVALIYTRQGNNTWQNQAYDFKFIPTYSNWNKVFRNVALYKAFSNYPDPYNYHFLLGSPDFTDNKGYMYYVSYSYTSGVSYLHFSHNYAWYPYYAENLPGYRFGNTSDLSYDGEVYGIPGYDNKGAVIFGNHYKKKSQCDAGIDLSFENFTKYPETYQQVIARNISIGGSGKPAEFPSNTTIDYIGKEIVLKDGFFAEEGAFVNLISEDCFLTDGKSSKGPQENKYLPEMEESENKNMKINEIAYIGKILRVKYQDFPWITHFDPQDNQSKVAVANERKIESNINLPNKKDSSFPVSTESKNEKLIFTFFNKQRMDHLTFLLSK